MMLYRIYRCTVANGVENVHEIRRSQHSQARFNAKTLALNPQKITITKILR